MPGWLAVLGSAAAPLATAARLAGPPPSLLPPADTSDYWQQEVHYQIRATLDEATGTITARGELTYRNRSPDTLGVLYLHLYLNAFRPGSRWSDRDSVEDRRRFNHLQDPDHGFERIGRLSVNGVPTVVDFPYAPDSTVARVRLPAAMAPGDSAVVRLIWQARPSTVVRRQGRRGRRFDFAQWYPKVAVYDRYGWQARPLYPAGEFYGEFGTFDVLLDVPEDQVVGATGVPLEGDPGWDRARANPGLAIDYQRDWYAARPASGSGAGGGQTTQCGAAGPGRKCLRFYAEQVHDFAMSLNPEYRYEEGRFKDVVIRVLYLPEDRSSWGNGVVVERTAEALRWLDSLYGPYPWPQLTNVHRIDGGGTEYPMMVMNGGPSLGLILHEVGHNYTMGILGNNEWKEGFLDEGFTSFQTTWYFEDHSPGYDGYSEAERFILDLDLDRWSEPVSMVSDEYRDFNTYNAMIYTKGELFFHQLRYVVGPDVMRRILREYYARWRLKHVDETALREVAERVSGQDLKGLFAQWLHGTPIFDYAIGKVKRRRVGDDAWETTLQVRRQGDGWMPVEIGERAGRRPGQGNRGTGSGNRDATVYARAGGRAARETVTFRTASRPGTLVLDPRLMTHDWNYLNNRERRFFDLGGGADWRFDTFVRQPSRRDRPVISLAPTVWYTDAGGWTVGARQRSNYLGRFDRWTAWVGRGVDGSQPSTFGDGLDYYFRIENPTPLARPHVSQSAELYAVEGRVGAAVRWQRERRRSWYSQDVLRSGWVGRWMMPRNVTFLDPGLWEKAGTVEVGRFVEWNAPSGATRWTLRLDYGGGVAYARRGIGSRLIDRFDVEGFGRATGSMAVRRERGALSLGARVFAGGYLAESPPPLQRGIPISGADPYQTFDNPMVRSRGAAWVRPDVFYHTPGNGNLRGYAPGQAGRWVAAANVEIEAHVLRARSGVVRRVSVAAFGDWAVADSMAIQPPSLRAYSLVADAGLGARALVRVGDLTVPLRVEFPFFVSRPAFAHDTRYGTRRRFQVRWLFSFQPTW